MDRKFLEGFGLEKEQINQILDEHSMDIGRKKEENDSRLETEKLKFESLQKELEAANETIKTLQKNNKDNESLQSQIEKYKAEIENVQEQAKEEKIKLTLSMALSGAGAINPKAVIPFIEMDKISVDKSGEVIGISDQLDLIKKNDDLSFLFKPPATEAVPNNPERGGFEPLKAGSPDEQLNSLSQGALIGREFRQLKEQSSTADYWSKIE